MWCEVLDLDEIGVEDSFFQLGGDSIRVLSRPGHGVTIASWFQDADAAQADALQAAEAEGALSLAPEMREAIARIRKSHLLVLDK